MKHKRRNTDKVLDKVTVIIVSALMIAALLIAFGGSPTTADAAAEPKEEMLVSLGVKITTQTIGNAPVIVTDEKETMVVEIRADEIELMAKMLWGECRGETRTEQAACAWVVCNRVDAGYGDIRKVITAPSQFTGYRESNPVEDELAALARDVLIRWKIERHGITNVGRVIPSDYLWFSGNGEENVFRNAYKGGTRWTWTMTSPYEEADNDYMFEHCYHCGQALDWSDEVETT